MVIKKFTESDRIYKPLKYLLFICKCFSYPLNEVEYSKVKQFKLTIFMFVVLCLSNFLTFQTDRVGNPFIQKPFDIIIFFLHYTMKLFMLVVIHYKNCLLLNDINTMINEINELVISLTELGSHATCKITVNYTRLVVCSTSITLTASIGMIDNFLKRNIFSLTKLFLRDMIRVTNFYINFGFFFVVEIILCVGSLLQCNAEYISKRMIKHEMRVEDLITNAHGSNFDFLFKMFYSLTSLNKIYNRIFSVQILFVIVYCEFYILWHAFFIYSLKISDPPRLIAITCSTGVYIFLFTSSENAHQI